MTRTGPSKRADRASGTLRLKKAEAFLAAAREGLALLRTGDIADPVVSNIVMSAIGFADAVTAGVGGVLNRQDYRAVVKLLTSLLKADFPQEQAARLSRILARKDEAQYGTGFARPDDAARLLAELEKFAHWARQLLGERGV